MDLRSLRYFVAVSEDLSFTVAAQRLGISQPPLSVAIARLERDLGTVLFSRGPRQRPTLTPAGEVLLRAARRILAEADAVGQLVGGPGTASWPLRVGAVPSTLAGLLPVVIPRFRARFGGVQMLVHETEERACIAEVSSGRTDIGLCRSTASAAEGCRLAALPDEPMLAVLPASHRLAARASISLGDLDGEGFVMFDREDAPTAHDIMTSACFRAGFSMQITMSAHNDLSLMGIVASGLAVSLMPRCSRYAALPGISFVPLSDEWAHLPLTLVTSPGPQTEVVAAFCATVRSTWARMQREDGNGTAVGPPARDRARLPGRGQRGSARELQQSRS
jgi:DNA-binding transcriptional LysR family regulator